MGGEFEKGTWGAVRPQVRRDHSPALTWLSLVGLLPSRAQLRFTRQVQVYQDGIADEEVHGCEISGYGCCCEDIIPPEKPTAVQLKTILNYVEPYKSFVYKKARWADPRTKTTIEILIEPRANGRAICSGCGQPAPGYDRLAERRFEFVPLWQIAVFFVYAMRRVECPRCGVKVEQVPWCDGKNQLTTTYRWFLAGWAKRLSWKGVAEAFGTTWQNVFRSVKHAVSWGLAHRSLEGIEAIGVDEVQWQKGHKYLTLVYQIDAGRKRLLWIGQDRTAKTFLRFFRMLGKERSSKLKFICSDMWKPYLKVIANESIEITLYHNLANLPEPEFTHRF